MQRVPIEEMARRFKLGLLLVSLATICALGLAMLRENVLPEWRRYRKQYAGILDEKATDELGRTIADHFEVGIDHNVLPLLDTIDRCITCHTGLEDPRMVEEPQPFTTHPGRYIELHPPELYGCTVCHQGQGRATERSAAHGRVAHWDTPMFESQYMFTSCARCHTESDVYGEDNLIASAAGEDMPISAARLIAGKKLVDSAGCVGCHVLRGVGGTLGPDITFVGDKTRHEFDFSHFSKDEPHEVEYWLNKHFRLPAVISPGTVMPDMQLGEEEADALTAYMLSLRNREVPPGYRPRPDLNRPDPLEPTGSDLYASLCSACHGRYGEESDVPGIRTPAINNLDSLAVASDDYYRYIIAQGKSNTTMPAWGSHANNLSHAQIDLIVEFIRGWEAEGAARTEVSSRAGDAKMGRSYYQGLCTNCHGRKGEGGIGTSLNSATFLAAASDRFLAETIIGGRPGTAMASWRHLPQQAVSDMLAYIRSWQSTSSNVEDVNRELAAMTRTDVERTGKGLYEGKCAACHGLDGAGGMGTHLSSADVLRAVDDEFLYTTIAEGRPTTAMPAWRHLSSSDVAALIAYVRIWQTDNPLDFSPPSRKGDYALGEVHYRVSCMNCHGEKGEGGVGPQLANRVLLKSVSDETLLHWIGRGRTGTAMKGFGADEGGITRLTYDHIIDVIAYLRYLGARSDRPILRTAVGDAHVGAQLFEGNCSSCHGVHGEGSSGPQLNNPAFLKEASDGFLSATMALGRTGTPMRAMLKGTSGLAQIPKDKAQDIIAYMRLWDYDVKWRAARPVAEMSKRAIDSGRTKFDLYCAGCHGPAGKGQRDGPEYFAPALNNREFLNAASDGFLLATIARGRSRTPMRPFGIGTSGIAPLGENEINDIVSYIRTWQSADMPKGD
jgi:cbb3-type cytochrome c oxidase subunit III